MRTKRLMLRLAAGTLCLAMFLALASCKTHKDCRGRKKTARTQMGGWL